MYGEGKLVTKGQQWEGERLPCIAQWENDFPI